MKRAKGRRKKMNCLPLKEAVSGRDRDLYIYIYNFIGFVCFLCFLYLKFFFFFFGRDLILSSMAGST